MGEWTKPRLRAVGWTMLLTLGACSEVGDPSVGDDGTRSPSGPSGWVIDLSDLGDGEDPSLTEVDCSDARNASNPLCFEGNYVPWNGGDAGVSGDDDPSGDGEDPGDWCLDDNCPPPDGGDGPGCVEGYCPPECDDHVMYYCFSGDCEPAPECPEPPPEVPDSCWLTAGGQIEPTAGAGRNFGGNAKSFKSGGVDGEWNHITSDGNHFHGEPREIFCELVPGGGADHPRVDVNRATFSGFGIWNGEGGYTFTVVVDDHGEPGNEDFYSLEVRDSSGTVVYSEGDVLARGNVQIHPANAGHP